MKSVAVYLLIALLLSLGYIWYDAGKPPPPPEWRPVVVEREVTREVPVTVEIVQEVPIEIETVVTRVAERIIQVPVPDIRKILIVSTVEVTREVERDVYVIGTPDPKPEEYFIDLLQDCSQDLYDHHRVKTSHCDDGIWLKAGRWDVKFKCNPPKNYNRTLSLRFTQTNGINKKTGFSHLTKEMLHNPHDDKDHSFEVVPRPVPIKNSQVKFDEGSYRITAFDGGCSGTGKITLTYKG